VVGSSVGRYQMNRTGHIIVAATALVLAALAVFPPRRGSGDPSLYLTRGFLFSSGKQTVKVYSYPDRTRYDSATATVDYQRLFLESWVVVLLAAVLMACLRASSKSIGGNEASQER